MNRDGVIVACFNCASWTRNPDVRYSRDGALYAARDGRCGVSVQFIKDLNALTGADFHCSLFTEKDEPSC